MAFQHKPWLGVLYRTLGHMARGNPDWAHRHEPNYSLEWVPEGELYVPYKADGVDSRNLQISLPSDNNTPRASHDALLPHSIGIYHPMGEYLVGTSWLVRHGGTFEAIAIFKLSRI